MKIKDNIKKHLLAVLEEIEKEEDHVREKLVQESKQLELYWHGFQYIFWDANIQDYRIPTHDALQEISSREDTKFIYDYVVNIFKAHGLSIIAALSAEVPGVSFSPFDASDPSDTRAAKKAEELGKIITKKNRAKMLFYHALFLLFTNHYVASYTYYERNKKYGEVDIPKYKRNRTKSPDTYDCPDCDYSTTAPIKTCPTCGVEVNRVEGEVEDILEEVGMETKARGMSRIITKGVLNVKVPTYASDQESCGYLIDYTEHHYSYLRNLYKDIRDEISPGTDGSYDREARMQSVGNIYSETYVNSLATLKRVWLRPWMFDILDESAANELKEEFPEGAYFAVIDSGNDILAEYAEENMDDVWTIAKGDLSRTVHSDPIGKPLLPMQDLENIVSNLLVESLEHSVPSVFADPEMIDFAMFSQQEVLPGAMYPAKNPMNPARRMDDYFTTLKTSTLPKEGVDFDEIIQAKGQFVVGAFPSIFGGPQSEGSKTLGEYQESRSFALQRLSIPYQMLYYWWSDTVYKAVLLYITNMITDERHTMQTANERIESVPFLLEDFSKGSFELLIPESAIDLPVSYSQKRQLISQILQLNSDFMNQYLFSPENRRVTLRYLGMEDLSDLDSSQTTKQLREIDDIIAGKPVQVEDVLDDHIIHLRVMRSYLASDIGQELKYSAPDVYALLLQHAAAHQQFAQRIMAQQQQGPQQQEEESPAPTEQ